MAGGDGYDAELGALRGGASDLVVAGMDISGYGDRSAASATGAAGGVLGGPLTGALAAFGERLDARSGDLSHAIAAASQSVQNCATTYEADDSAAASKVMADAAAMSQGSPSLGGLYTTMLAPQPAAAPPGLAPIIPGLSTP